MVEPTDAPAEEHRPDYEGDGYDPEPLLTARDVAERLQVPRDRVYELPIPRVRIGPRTVRWRPEAVEAWIVEREEQGA